MAVILVPPDPTTVNAWITILTPIAIAISTIVTSLGIKWAQQAAERANLAAINAKAAADASRIAEAKSSVKLDEIHTAVNSGYSESLNIGATALEKVAELTNKPEDAELAKAARIVSDTHAAGGNKK
jgi:hypothetical protein